jgi:hypothetical protein
MKRLFFALAVAGALTACNNSGDTKASGDSTNPDYNGAMMSAPSTDSMNSSRMAPSSSDSSNRTTAPMGDSSSRSPR